MKVIVRYIKTGTIVEDDEHQDTFEMSRLIGKEIEVSPHKRYKNWFCSDDGDEWNFHKSWLGFIKEIK